MVFHSEVSVELLTRVDPVSTCCGIKNVSDAQRWECGFISCHRPADTGHVENFIQINSRSFKFGLVFFFLTHLQCRAVARLDWQLSLVFCSPRQFVSALGEIAFLPHPPGLTALCSDTYCMCVLLCVCVMFFVLVGVYSVFGCRCLLLSLSRLISRLRSCCRKPGLG